MKFALIAYDAEAGSLAGLIAALTGGGVNVSNVLTVAGDDDDNGPANPAAPNLDSAGLPWDERIHSSSKAVTADGGWRKRKGVSEAVVNAVTQELRARGYAAPVAGAPVTTALAPFVPPVVTTNVPMPAPMPPVPPLASPGAVPPPPVPVPVPPQPAVPIAPVAAANPPPETVTDFNQFMQIIGAGLQSGMYDATYFAEFVGKINAAAGVNMTTITDLSQPAHAHLISYAAQLMRNDGKW